MELAPTPPAPADRRTLYEEMLAVLALSLLASAAFAIVSLVTQPVNRGVVVASADQNPLFANQVLGFVFGLAPAFLVIHLVRRDGEGVASIGLSWDQPRRDATRGIGLFAVVGAAGLGIYLAAVQLGVNRLVVPVAPGHWWTWPALLMTATQAAVLEEVIVLGYLVTRLQQVGWTPIAAVVGCALLRGGYHLYQGWGGFAGNLLMGLLFGFLFLRWRRTWPFVIAHLLLDFTAGAGWLLFHQHLPGG